MYERGHTEWRGRGKCWGIGGSGQGSVPFGRMQEAISLIMQNRGRKKGWGERGPEGRACMCLCMCATYRPRIDTRILSPALLFLLLFAVLFLRP